MVDAADRAFDGAGGVRLTGARSIAVGSVLAQLFRQIGRHWLTYFGVALAFAALNCVQFLNSSLPRGRPVLVVSSVVIVIQLVAGTIVQAGFIHSTTQALEGGALSLGETLRVGARRFFPYLGAAILFYLALALGAVLLLVPAAFVFCIYGLSPSASVVERLGPVRSMSRSRVLTRGNRWRVLAVTLLAYAPYFVFFGALGAYGFSAAARGEAAALAGKTVGINVATVIITFVMSPVFFVLPAVLYHHLRRAEGTAGPANLAEVFA